MDTKLRFVYYLWIPDGGFNWVMDIHWKCLELYHDVFDEALFIVSTNELNLTTKTVIDRIQSLGYRNLTIKIVKNRPERESFYFKKEIIDRLDNYDGLTFFAHTKCLSDLFDTQTYEKVCSWVVSLYFFNLTCIEKIKSKLIDDKYFSYGFNFHNENWITTKYHWAYMGTFFWLNGKKIHKYIEENNVEVPSLYDWTTVPHESTDYTARIYSENILSSIYPEEYACHTDIEGERSLYSPEFNLANLKRVLVPCDYNNFLKFYNDNFLDLDPHINSALRLVYYLWVPDDGFNWVMDIHWRCLKYYKDVFDDALFIVASNNDNDENVNFAVKKIRSIGYRNLEIKLVENKELERESYYLKSEVFDKLGEYNGLTFFAHSKSTSDRFNNTSRENVALWISSMYYFCLSNPTEVKDCLFDDWFFSYGFMFHDGDWISTKYHWIYSGTFYWIYGRKLKKYLSNCNIELPTLYNWSTVEHENGLCARIYSENVLSSLYPKDYTFVKKLKTERCLYDYELSIDNLRNILFENDFNGFMDFYNNEILDLVQNEDNSQTKLRMVYYMWVPLNGTSKVMDIHWKILEKYSNIFDTSLFLVSCDDNESENLKTAIEKIKSIGFKDCTIKIVKNNPQIRESYYFKSEIIDKIGNFDGLTFFAHSKGNCENDRNFVESEISAWVASMYFFNLNYIEDVKRKLVDEKYISYGAFLEDNLFVPTKHHWMYTGTFMWINEKKLKDYILSNDIKVPGLYDYVTKEFKNKERFYSEHVLSSIFPIEFAYSRQKTLEIDDFYTRTTKILEYVSDKNDLKEFNNFYTNIILNKKSTMKNKICVYTICKNESQFVEKWVKSMSEADAIVVLDTGSTDDTVEKLRKLGVTVEQKIINPWRFDVARNESLKLVPDDCNILISTDLDEILEPGWADVLRKNWVEGKYKQCWYKYAWSHMPDGSDGRVFWYCKIHARGFKWEFPVHETLTYENEEYRKKLENLEDLWISDGIKLHHYPTKKASRSNYLPLLEQRVIENPDDFSSNIYLGHEYYYTCHDEKCIERMKIILEKFTDVTNLETASCYLFMGDAYYRLGDFKNAETAYRNAILADNTYREGYIGLANVLMDEKNPDKNIGVAFTTLKQALKNSWRHFSWLERDDSYSYHIYDLLCLAAYYSGHKKESLFYAFVARELNQNNDKRLDENVKVVMESMKDGDYA